MALVIHFQSTLITQYSRPEAFKCFLGSSADKESTCDARDLGSIPGLGRSPGGGHVHSLQYSCLKNPHGQRKLWATVHGVAKNWTQLTRHSRVLLTQSSVH